VGRSYAGQQVLVRFDPGDRNFVFYPNPANSQASAQEIGRKPARGLEIADFFEVPVAALNPIPPQIPLPLAW
jgi:hypothetical protein